MKAQHLVPLSMVTCVQVTKMPRIHVIQNTLVKSCTHVMQSTLVKQQSHVALSILVKHTHVKQSTLAKLKKSINQDLGCFRLHDAAFVLKEGVTRPLFLWSFYDEFAG
jgi:hypothetical protein